MIPQIISSMYSAQLWYVLLQECEKLLCLTVATLIMKESCDGLVTEILH